MSEKKPLPGWMRLRCSPVSLPDGWRVFGCELREAHGEDPFPYIALTGAGHVETVDSIGAELFNHQLQAVDVSDVDSILSFCSRYGTPTSPIYDGEQRLRLFRACRNAAVRYEPLDGGKIDAFHANRQVLATIGSKMQRRDPVDDRVEMDCLLPAILSERARGEAIGDDAVVGAVSVLEVAQAIRLLQTSTSLLVAFRYATGNGWSLEDLFEYLENGRYVAQTGAGYWLKSEDALFRGHTMTSYDGMLRHQDFSDMVGETTLPDPKAIYDTAAAQELYRLCDDAVEFVNVAAASYAKMTRPPDSQYMGGGLFYRVDPFMRLREKRLGEECGEVSREGCIGSAVLYQFAAGFSLDDDEAAPYRECEYCKRIFRKYQEEGSKKNLRATRFCRRNCNYAFNKRSYRRDRRDSHP